MEQVLPLAFGERGIQWESSSLVTPVCLVSALTLLCTKPGTPQSAGSSAALSINPLLSGLWHADFNILLLKYGAMGWNREVSEEAYF